MQPPAAVHDRFRRAILDRGRVLATRLADALAGKPVPTAGLPGKPGMTPAEKLRLALDHVEARRRLLDAGDDAFGRCAVCGVDLGAAELDEMPWADRCPAHAAS